MAQVTLGNECGMIEKPQWRIYYADGTTFDSTQGEPWEAPAIHVLGINQRHQDPSERPYHVWRANFFTWKQNQWFGMDQYGFFQYMFVDKWLHPKAVLLGEFVSNPIWDAFVQKIKADTDFFE